VSPERSDRAPVVIVTAHNEGASDWARAVADRVAEAGFIAVVPDELTGEGPGGGDNDSFRAAGAVQSALARLGPQEISGRVQSVQRFALASPACSGIAAQLDISPSEGFISAGAQAGAIAATGKFAFSDEGFAAALTFIRKATNDHPVFTARTVQNDHAMHLALLAKAASKTAEIGQPGQPGGDTSYYQKRPDLPADFNTAKSSSTPGSNIPRFKEE
jgi:dienelactone hydrolase